MPRHDTVALFCETPFQLILCLNAAVNYLGAKRCIAFPVRDMYMSDRKFEVPEQPPLLPDVYPVRRAQYSQSKWEGRANHLRYGKNYTILDYMYKFPRHMDFTAAVGIRYTDRCRRILAAFGKTVPYYMVEEGIGEYSFPRVEGELCAATLGQYPMFSSLEHVCLLPELYRALYPGEAVAQAPTVPADSALCPVLRRQFGAQTLPPLPKILYFHQPSDDLRPDPADRQAFFDAENAVLALLADAAPGQFKLKLHPRDKAVGYPAQQILALDAAWEIVPALQNVENMLLASENSTALITPKLLFDQEPKVLVLECLYRRGVPEDTFARHMRLMQAVRAAYRRPERFCIPQTMQDLRRDLKRLTAEG